MEKTQKKQKVFVGLSGGVDSSVSAALLKKAGYDVTGVFIKAWSPENFDCGWRDERRDAMRVAAALDIPFITLDLSKEYKEEVVDYMIAEYQKGRTPNPDVMCNKSIKFGAFFKKARTAGADYVATGHYAKIISNSKLKIKNGTKTEEKHEMLAGVDKEKDQSYFLWTLRPEVLAHTLFPIGHLPKTEVRKLASKFKLPTATKKDSQGVCFIGKLDVKDFLKEFMTEKAGDVLNEKGEIVGHHGGALFFTIGERHGFSITKKTPNDKPFYVIAKNIEKNTIVVSNSSLKKTKEDLEVKIDSISWTLGTEPDVLKKYQARIRYRQPLQTCYLQYTEGQWTVVFDKPQEAVTSGQSLVIYDGEICLGGGVIK